MASIEYAELKINPWRFPVVKKDRVRQNVPRFKLDLQHPSEESKDTRRGLLSRQPEVSSSPEDVYMTPSPTMRITNPLTKRQVSSPRNIPRATVSSPSGTVSSPDEVFLTPSPRRSFRKLQLNKTFDPYQVFEVEHRPCVILEVTVLCGRKITKGWADMMDTPDPYIYIYIPTAPEGRQKTTVKDNDVNPVWNESFTFYIDEAVDNFMEIRLMESNYMYDEVIGVKTLRLGDIRSKLYKSEKMTLVFNEVSEIDIKISLTHDTHPTLRYSLCLCDEEKEFLKNRRKHVFEGLKNLLGDKAPRFIDEVPNISVIGSGGGFRAMVGLSGVIKALHDSGILQCCTYVGGLSGSSWYISTLYSHQNWPNMAPGDMQEELKNNINSSLLWLLSPQGVYRYLDRIMKKRKNGQPVSFTDFFGHMVGETLLKTRLDTKLSDQQEKIADGLVPLPLLTCVHVKKDRSARSFQEWVEFSPYEIGMAKYGTFMKTEQFGSKFFMGKLVKSYEEPPLHFLQGIWGSAFCILFKRLLDDNRKLDPVEMIRQDMAKQLEENEQDESSDSSDDGEFNDAEDTGNNTNGNTLNSVPKMNGQPAQNGKGANVPRAVQLAPKRMVSTRRTKSKGYWSNVLRNIVENKNLEVLSTRAGRAGVIHNFMRGLSLQQSYPLSPFTPLTSKSMDVLDGADAVEASDVETSAGVTPAGEKRVTRASDDFDGIFEMHPTNVKHLYMVDAGLTFNSPYPLMLRPQRAMDIILSFDFSARPSDSTPPFKELLLAENWARKHKISFPPIDTTVFDREGLKELYIFKHPTDPHCPIVLHFCLVNIEFRKFVKPGVRRRTKEEKEFADFDIFDDPTTPFSTFNFTYPGLAFDRLSKLTEFNTLLNIDRIKEVIAEVSERKRLIPSKCPCTLEDIPRLRRVSQKNKNRLSRFVSRIRSGRYSATEAAMNLESERTIAEESSIDVQDGAIPKSKTITRQRAITKKSIKPGLKRSDGNVVDLDPNNGDVSAEKREIPGRRKPKQPETAVLWQDSHCNSIDEEEDTETQYFSAVISQ